MSFSVGVRARSVMLGAALMALMALALWGATAARGATTFTVTTTTDSDDGSCTATLCSLRDAVKYSSAGDTVVVPAGTYTLVMGQLSVDHDLTITGAGAGSVTVSGNNSSRVFEIETGATVTLSGVTVTGGNGTGGAGGNGVGGGIKVFGTLTLNSSVVTANTAAVSGGGIDSNGTLNVNGSTISNNTTTGPGFAIGGGIDCFCTSVAVTNSTISGNTASGGSSNQGGGILYSSGNPLILTNTTISGNTAGTDGGGVHNDNGSDFTNTTLAANSAPDGANFWVNDAGGTFQNTLFAQPQGGGSDCDSTGVSPASLGNNLQDDTTNLCWDSSTTQSTDQSGVNAKLGPLAGNGGPTQTMALLAGSPAIDKGATVTSITTDQRGGPRPQPPGGAYDIGAYEASAVVDMGIAKSASPNPVTVGGTLTYTLTATNTGPTSDPAFSVAVSDTLPSSVTPRSATSSQGSCSSSSGTVTCSLGTVNQGSSATVTIAVTPNSAGSITNRATVSSSAKDYNGANDSASVTTQVQAATTTTTTTSGSKPSASTGRASGIAFTSATLHGTVNPNGEATTYHFVYGRTTHYGSHTSSAGVGAGTTAKGVSRKIGGLHAGTLYHYRIVAQNATGTVMGTDRTFRTPRRPSLHVRPSHVTAGSLVRVFGNAGGCPVGDQVTLISGVFSHAHDFAGQPAIFAQVKSGGRFSTVTRIPTGRSAGRYGITARCGGGNLGVSAHLTVVAAPSPVFTG